MFGFLVCFVSEDSWLFALTYSPICGNSQSKTIRFDDRQSLERARHELKKKKYRVVLCSTLQYSTGASGALCREVRR